MLRAYARTVDTCTGTNAHGKHSPCLDLVAAAEQIDLSNLLPSLSTDDRIVVIAIYRKSQRHLRLHPRLLVSRFLTCAFFPPPLSLFLCRI